MNAEFEAMHKGKLSDRAMLDFDKNAPEDPFWWVLTRATCGGRLKDKKGQGKKSFS